MTKDVTLSHLEALKPVYKPGEITFDFDSFDKAILAAVALIDDKNIGELDYDEIKNLITKYKALDDNLEEERKKISRDFKDPLTDFENQLKKSRTPLGDLLDKLRTIRDEIDEHHRLLRLDVVRANFEDKCMVAGLEKDTFADKYDGYSLKKYFKPGKNELKKTTLDEFDALVLAEFDALEQSKANKEAIKEQAKEYDLPAEGYIRHLEDGKSLVDVLKLMKSDRDAIAFRKEQQEAQAKAEAERLAEIERIAREDANNSIKAIDADTGEIIENSPLEPVKQAEGLITPRSPQYGLKQPQFTPSEPLTVTMTLTLHGGKHQLDNLKEYLEDNFISFKTLEG